MPVQNVKKVDFNVRQSSLRDEMGNVAPPNAVLSIGPSKSITLEPGGVTICNSIALNHPARTGDNCIRVFSADGQEALETFLYERLANWTFNDHEVILKTKKRSSDAEGAPPWEPKPNML